MKPTNAYKSPNGTRYWRQGKGMPVVLIHGVGLDATMWQSQFKVLAKDYDVIAYDMLGHGESGMPSEDVELEHYADQLAKLLDHLELDRVAVVGFSMGGLVARAYALRYPSRLTAMMILSSVFERSEDQRAGVKQRLAQARDLGPEANIDAALERWFSPAFHSSHPEHVLAIRQKVISNDPEGYYRSYSLFGTQDCFGADQLESIRVPVLVATGEFDQGSTPWMARAMAERLPNAEVNILPGQRHMVPVEAPELVNSLLMRFLDGIKNRSSLEEAH